MAQTRSEHYRYVNSKEALLARMKKVEGQAKGIQRMMEDERYCLDILQQLTALTAATNEVALLVLEGHIEGCVTNAIREGRSEDEVKELMAVIRKAWR